MPKNPDIKKVLVLGSGPIVIGQAAEFDYAGTQACRSLKEEGIEVVLLNSNPATIMTDKDIADRVYIEPLTLEVVEQLIKKEKPDSVLPTLGGQAGLNLAMELEEAGFLKENHVRLIGTTALTIKKAEDREMFKETMEKIGEPVAPSDIVENVEDGLRIADQIGYPVVLRPAYTLGGSGGGIADNPEQCREILENGLRLSRVGQVLVERCIAGALEVYTVPVGMKKSRPGTLLSVLCHEDQKEKLVRVIFQNTTTIGVREHSCSRYTLKRSFETVQTPYGEVQKKISSGYGVTREKYEYEDLARIAREQGISLAEVRKSIAHK